MVINVGISRVRNKLGHKSKRGCIEHIVTLRLVIDRCVRKKQPLFIAFIDFSKAYERFPCNYLLKLLRNLRCGAMILKAITSLLRTTKFVLGAPLITVVIEVKQGSRGQTRLPKIVLSVQSVCRRVRKTCKEAIRRRRFWGWLHLLMLMDDTVLFATSRNRLIEKLNLLADWCNRCGMVINEDKFMAFVTNDPDDKIPIILNLHHGVVKSFVVMSTNT